MDIKAQITHRILGTCDISTFVTGDTAPQLTVESFVKEARAVLVVLDDMTIGGGVQFVDDKLIVFMSILLAVPRKSLENGR